jgi:HEAT repeat protein
METEEALNFLAQHKNVSQNASQRVIDMYDEVRKHFESNPDERCIPLFLESFGDHMGWGIFQLCDDVFNKYPVERIVPHLKRCLKSPNKGTRWWAAHWAMEFNNPDLTEELIDISKSEIDSDAHYFALAALRYIYRTSRNAKILNLWKSRKEVEDDDEIIELLDELIQGANNGMSK